MRKKLRSSRDEDKAKRKEILTAKRKLYGWRDGTHLPQGWRLNRKSLMAKQFRSLQRTVISKAFKDNIEKNRRKVKHLRSKGQ